MKANMGKYREVKNRVLFNTIPFININLSISHPFLMND